MEGQTDVKKTTMNGAADVTGTENKAEEKQTIEEAIMKR